eukprot:7291667-Pyramimonas_sp.AAC.1
MSDWMGWRTVAVVGRLLPLWRILPADLAAEAPVLPPQAAEGNERFAQRRSPPRKLPIRHR